MVPVLAEEKLIFFITAPAVLRLGFVTKCGDVLAVAEWCLHTVKACSASPAASPASKVRCKNVRLGGDSAGTAGPS